MKFLKVILLFLCFTTAGTDLVCQGENLSDSKREEIQRYFGYETLLLRYYTAPYDVTMNVNERGNFLDIGFLYLMFLPILLLIAFAKNRVFVILSILFLLLLVIFSSSNSFIYDSNNVRLIENRDGKYLEELNINFASDPIGAIVDKMYSFNNAIYKPLNKVVKMISGPSDYFTYPILFLLFAFYSYHILKRFKGEYHKPKYILIFVVWFYSFLWFILSAGIVWYGYLMLLLGLALIVMGMKALNKSIGFNRFLINSFYGLAFLWIFLGLTNRISNINPATPNEHQGKGMYNPSFYSYSAGYIDEDGTIEALYPNLALAVKRMNRFNQKLIYRVGTSFNYFINNNQERVFMDNQLGFFNRLVQKYPDKRVLTQALKASNFKFLIVDLFTPTIDRTPERTLTKKYNTFMNFLHKNNQLRLIGTDRVVIKDGNEGVREFGVFGEIVANGSYAIYEIQD